MIINKGLALSMLEPDAEFVVIDDKEIQWMSKDIKQPTDEAIEAELARLKAVETYQKPRRDSYPPLQEQLDMLYWDQVNGTTTWKDSITKVKTDYPKPTK